MQEHFKAVNTELKAAEDLRGKARFEALADIREKHFDMFAFRKHFKGDMKAFRNKLEKE